MRLLGQAVKTSPFHGGNTGSIPVGVIKATQPSGKARVCNTLIIGSNPIVASKIISKNSFFRGFFVSFCSFFVFYYEFVTNSMILLKKCNNRAMYIRMYLIVVLGVRRLFLHKYEKILVHKMKKENKKYKKYQRDSIRESIDAFFN